MSDEKIKYLTTKDEAFARAVVETGSVASAYKAVVPYATEGACKTLGTKYGRKPEIKARILELLEKDKRTKPKALVERLGDLTEAKKEVLGKDGEIRELRDNPVRLEAIKTALKIYDVIKDNNIDIVNNTMVVQMTPDEASRMERVVAQMKALNEQLGLDGVQDGEIVPIVTEVPPK